MLPGQKKLSGGCLCGNVRYESDATPRTSVICHCETCRHTHGAPMVGWVMVPAASVRLLNGKPDTYRSSERATRQFCNVCGTSLFYIADVRPDEIDIATGTLDDPSLSPPVKHIWGEQKLDWVKLADGLPVWAQSSVGPDARLLETEDTVTGEPA